MKKNIYFSFMQAFLLLGMVSLLTLVSCKKEEEPQTENPVASFQYAISNTNFLEVVFTNFSKNATTYTWNFGDGQTSTEKDPTHVYAASGTFTVLLTAKNDAGTSATYSQTIEIKDPNAALAKLAGEVSKTWKLYRVGTSLGIGPNPEQARTWWSLDNTGVRPCVYYHEFTFKRDGSFVFDDKGMFWGEDVIFNDRPNLGTCFEAVAANMINRNGADVSAFLSGTHTFTYEPTTNLVTLNGTGAWMGLAKLGTTGERDAPEASTAFNISIEEHTGYDLLTISYTYAGPGHYWDATFVHYYDPSLEPDVVEEQQPWGTDLPDLTPTAIFNTFASTNPADVEILVPTTSAVTLNVGVDDPADPTAAKVGQYIRGTEMYADLKFQTEYDIQFNNFTKVSIDVYMPSTNTYSEGGLAKSILLWIADASQTQEFWNSWVEFQVDPTTIVLDQWQTFTFMLDAPTGGSGTPLTRSDLDLFGMTIGGSGHTVDGTFYIRNFKFE